MSNAKPNKFRLKAGAAPLLARTGFMHIYFGNEPQEIEFSTLGWEAERDLYLNDHPEPRPRSVATKLITPDSPEGKAFGITKNEIWPIYDRDDPQFKSDYFDWLAGLGYWIAQKVLIGFEITDESDRPVTDRAARIKILKDHGLAAVAAQQILSQVNAHSGLAREEAVRFFDKRLGPTRPNGAASHQEGSGGTSPPPASLDAPSASSKPSTPTNSSGG